MRHLDVTTVSDTHAVVHAVTDDGSVSMHRFDDLEPDATTRVTVHDAATGEHVDVDVTTLAPLTGTASSMVATVNDVHFGEVAAGQIDDHPIGPIRRAEPGDEPYPEVMNRAAADEMTAADPDVVVVKGDLSVDGEDHEWEAFERCYRDPFGERLHVVRGNHDAYQGQDRYAGDQRIDVAGLTIALLDTVIPGATTGMIRPEQIEWLDAVAADATNPVLVMGHHQQWIATAHPNHDDDAGSATYFGLHPDASNALDDVCARRASIIAYSAGHTHRHRVRTMTKSGIPTIEVGCTKDFPGTWAEHRVHGDGVMHLAHRMSSPEALAWSEPCRELYADFGLDYSAYALGELSDRCFTIPFR